MPRRAPLIRTLVAPAAVFVVSLVSFCAATRATTTAAAPSGVALTVSPTAVHRGALVVIRGDAGDCPVGDTVTVLSRAFRRTHQFAGVPAVLAKVRTHGLFRASTRIPLRRRAGRYFLTARCGGGNLGVAARLVVLP